MTDKAQNEKEDGSAVVLQRGVIPAACEWRQSRSSDYPLWETSCEKDFVFIEDQQKEDYNYCPNCGGKIKQV